MNTLNTLKRLQAAVAESMKEITIASLQELAEAEEHAAALIARAEAEDPDPVKYSAETAAAVIKNAARNNMGFFSPEEIAIIATGDRLHQILVRCGACRFTAPAQDISHLIKCIEAGGDHVRDVSLPAGDPAFNW